MNKTLRKLALIATAAVGWMGQANADVITINFTADNITGGGGLCSDMSCTVGVNWASIGSIPNSGDWRVADTVTLDLGPGTYWFAWGVQNVGDPGSGNPAGLLAEILWDSTGNYSSSGWEVSTDTVAWTSATSYGYNGGANIWTSVNGGPVSGISTNAQWLWTANNGNREMDEWAAFRTSITIVPEPGTLALFAIGLLGMGLVARSKTA